MAEVMKTSRAIETESTVSDLIARCVESHGMVP